MLTYWLNLLDFPKESISFLNENYELLKENVPEQFQKAKKGLLLPSTAAFEDATDEILSLTNLHRYTLNIILCLACLDELSERYKAAGKEEKFNSYAKKLPELFLSCKNSSGIWGIEEALWNWMFHDLGCVRLGRLLYEPYFHFASVEYNGIKREDEVILIHIPGGEKLDMDAVESSLKLAYEKFKDRFKNAVVPFMTHSWLIYPPYLDGVFKQGSNLDKFARLFTVIEQNDEHFAHFPTVFGMPYSKENLELVPQKTSLQKNMLRFIKDGNNMGSGYGIFFYDENGIVK